MTDGATATYYLAQCFRTQTLMLSEPGELPSMVLLMALITSSVLKARMKNYTLQLDSIICFKSCVKGVDVVWEAYRAAAIHMDGSGDGRSGVKG